jgi:redox-sensitive bicupin YhaK (pirin superfamily)
VSLTKIECKRGQASELTPTANSKYSHTSSLVNWSSTFFPCFMSSQSHLSISSKDSMGNTEILKRGSLQLTSAGTGISHSEKAHGSKPVHFLQIWSLPHTSRLQPKYFTRQFSDAEKTDAWVRVVAPVGSEGVTADREGSGPAPVQSALTLYATILGEGKKLEKGFEGKKGYVHVIQTSKYNAGKADGASVRISGGGEELVLREGDGLYLSVQTQGQKLVVENVGDGTAEILLFDLE